jgi:hypothetical protein
MTSVLRLVTCGSISKPFESAVDWLDDEDGFRPRKKESKMDIRDKRKDETASLAL